MALNWDMSKMIERLGQEEYDRITDHPTIENNWHPVTDGLIWATMYIGLNEITEKNVKKWIDRMAAYQAVDGGYMQGADGQFFITEEDIRNHIGMWTNAETISDAKFKGRLYQTAVDAGKRGMRLQEKSAYELCKPKGGDNVQA